MANNLTVSLPKKEEELLKSAALRYGFSPDELSRRIIAEATRALLEIPEESLDEYENAEEIRNAFRVALRDERSGTLRRSLPRSLRR